MKNNIKSEVYRFIHSPLLLIHIIVPILGSFLFIAYSALSNQSEVYEVLALIQVLSVTFPVLIGIITGLSCEFEQNAGNFQLMLSSKTFKFMPHINKLLVLLIFGLASAIFTTTLFYIGFYFFGHTSFTALFFIKTAVLIFTSMIPLYLLSYIISFLFSKDISIGFGIVGGLISALLLTGLGDYNWWYTPWGIASRFSSSISTRHFGVDTIEINYAIIFLLMFTIILTTLFILIFKKWEGRLSGD